MKYKVYVAKKENEFIRIGMRFVIWPPMSKEFEKELAEKKPVCVDDISVLEPHFVPIATKNGLGIAVRIVKDIDEWFYIITMDIEDIPFLQRNLKRFKEMRQKFADEVLYYDQAIEMLETGEYSEDFIKYLKRFYF